MPNGPLPSSFQAAPERAKAIAAIGRTISVTSTRTVPLSIPIAAGDGTIL